MNEISAKRIVIITPFYPIKHRTDLFEDTKAVSYLIKGFTEDNNLLIVHIFNHNFISSIKNLAKIIKGSNNYTDYLHHDEYKNNVLFFENPLFIPKSIKSCNYFSFKHVRLLEEFCEKERFVPEVGIVHLPTYYVQTLRKVKLFPKLIAIIHSFDIKNIKRGNIDIWKKYFYGFNAIGFRSYKIKEEFEKLIGSNTNTFMCLSGIPENYISKMINSEGYSTQNEIKLLYAGRLDKNKNVAKTISALSKMGSNVKYSFTIIGEGRERKSIEKLSSKLQMNDNIVFEGKLSRSDTFKYMQQSDIFIMVSIKETLGLVYLEAMAAGSIVIGTKGQGIDGIVVNGVNGFLTDSSNENEIYQTILHVMSLSQEEQKVIRDNAKKTLQSLSDISVSKEYFENISNVIGGE